MLNPPPEEATTMQVSRDRLLVRRMLAGDERATKAFCTEYLPKLYRYAVRRLPSPQDVDDVVQVVLSNAARRIETYRGEATLLTWLIQICRHEISRHLSSLERHDAMLPFLNDDVLRSVVESLEAPATDDPEQGAHRLELIALVQVALDQLPTRYADALELRYIEGIGSKEIATRMRIGDEAAQSLLARARRAFREVCSEAILVNFQQTAMTTAGGRVVSPNTHD